MIDFVGWIPAVVLPFSTCLQLIKILRSRNIGGVSALSWGLFGFANLGAYFFTEKWFSPQALLAFFLSAVLDFWIVFLILKREKSEA